MLRNKTKPHAYSWLIWAITQGIAVSALLYGGGGWGGFGLIAGTILALSVFLLSLKYGSPNITRADTFILIAALSAILVWWQLESAFFAVLMVTAIDIAGYVPSIRKTYADPSSEILSTWIFFLITDIFSFLALSEYSVLTTTYLIGLGFANATLIAVYLWRRSIVKRAA